MKELQNKSAIITGAGSGIGRSAALLMAREGAKVAVADIHQKNAEETVDMIRNEGGEAFAILADTSQPGDNERLVSETVKKYGGLDIAVNNAGIAGPISLTGEYPLDGWQKVLDINLSGVFYGMRYQIPAMLNRGGSIINVASILGQVGAKGSPAYVAAKHGVVGLTKTAALEYGDKNIRINSIGPGYIKTPMLNILDEATLKSVAALHAIGRLGEAEEVAELIFWLASPRSSFVTGSYYAVDGGYLAQ